MIVDTSRAFVVLVALFFFLGPGTVFPQDKDGEARGRLSTGNQTASGEKSGNKTETGSAPETPVAQKGEEKSEFVADTDCEREIDIVDAPDCPKGMRQVTRCWVTVDDKQVQVGDDVEGNCL